MKVLKIFIISVLIAVLIDAGICLWKAAVAEEANGQAWVLCDPESYVNMRAKPNGRTVGGLDCGDHMWTDSVERNGFLHVVELSAEDTTAWVSLRYVVFDEPREIMRDMKVTGNAKVACRKWVDGPRQSWIRPGNTVRVLWMSDSWAYTVRGYIRSEYLTEAGNE